MRFRIELRDWRRGLRVTLAWPRNSLKLSRLR